ncbi:MAG: site-2 protease family protein [Candidatus Pacebacteria bacterium]|nr:site-2 protease family protein [Candidatus Paceibacterota bacterium]
MSAIDTIFYLLILLMSVVIHEVAHGFMAEQFGDDTARDAGRLTLNPIKHIDPFGSIILPALLFFSTAATGHPFVFGWAKPVPYNPNNLSNRKWGTIAVAAAGVLANIFIAVIFGILIRLSVGYPVSDSFYFVTSTIVLVNLALAIFNLVPIPPLDGSKILFSLLPASWYEVMDFIERYGFVLLLVFIFYFSDILYPILAYSFSLVTGLAF